MLMPIISKVSLVYFADLDSLLHLPIVPIACKPYSYMLSVMSEPVLQL